MPNDADLDELRSFIEQEEAADTFSGVVAIERGGETVFLEAYGFAHLGLRVANDVDTRLNTASITKMFTAVAVLQLVESGDLSLDATVSDVLPGVEIGMSDRITIRHLLTHQSGLGDYWTDECKRRRTTLRTSRDYLALVEGARPTFEPGTSTSYGNAGYVVLGAVIETASGVDYYDFVRENVCRRAGMARADHVHLDQATDFAHGYTYLEWEGPPHPEHRTDNIFQYPVRGSAATGLYASAPEIIAFGLALRGGELLGDTSVASMLRPPTGATHGLGTQVVPYSCGRAVGHGGRAHGGATIFLVLPEVDMSVCILSNYDRPADKRVFSELDRLLQTSRG